MMGSCYYPEISRHSNFQINNFNASYNKPSSFKQNNYRQNKNKFQKDNIIKKNQNIIPTFKTNKDNPLNAPKKLIGNKLYFEAEKINPKNKELNQKNKIIRKKHNLNPELNTEKITKTRKPSQAPDINRNKEKKQFNIHVIKEESNIQQSEMIPFYQPQQQETQFKIKNRNVSVINRSMKNNNNVLQKEEKVEKYSSGAIGLINIGNTCYFNAAIQNLKNVFLLTLYLLKNHNKDKEGFTYKYCELISNLINQDTYQWYEPRNFFLKLNSMTNRFVFGKQNDSNFLILYILTFLEKENKVFIGEKPFKKIQISSNFFSQQEKQSFSAFMDNFYEKKNSCINDIFYGFQEDIYKCNICLNATFNYQGFNVLNIPIMKRNKIPIYSLIEAINYYQEKQYHENEKGFICNKCLGNNISTQSRIISCPKTFIINFKRIGENNFYGHNLDIPFDFKLTNLVDGMVYENTLIGFIKYYGSGNYGHNIAICKNFFDSIWYEYDDSKVTSIHNSSNMIGNVIDTSGGFLFFYSRKDIFINDNDINLIKNLSRILRH